MVACLGAFVIPVTYCGNAWQSVPPEMIKLFLQRSLKEVTGGQIDSQLKLTHITSGFE